MKEEETDGSEASCQFVLCGSVGVGRSVVGKLGAYEKLQIHPDKPLGKLFIVHTNPAHTSLSLFSQPADPMSLGVKLFSIEQLDSETHILTLQPALSLIPIPSTNSKSNLGATSDEKHSSARKSLSEGGASKTPGTEVAQLFFRCPECKHRTLYLLKTLSDTLPCTHCNSSLTIYHWTGRLGPLNTMPIPDITSVFTNKYLFTNGFIQRKVNLWVRDYLGTMCYVDFRGKAIPSIYAFLDNSPVDRKRLPVILVQIRRELIPYLKRPTASELSKRRSRQDQIASTYAAPDPHELQATIDELTEKGIDVLKLLKEYDERLMHPMITLNLESKELNNDKSIIKSKCPECGSTNFGIVENNMGRAERCTNCNYLKLLGDDNNDGQSGRGNGNEGDNDEKRTPSADQSFF